MQVYNAPSHVWRAVERGSYDEISVYDIRGRLIVNLVNEFKKAGQYNIRWDANELGSGIYFYKIKAGDFFDIKKSILIK